MNLTKMMRDLQQMQARLQTQIAALEVTATAGGGVVTARMNGKKELTALEIEREAVTPEDLELLQDLILAAVNEAGRRVDEEVGRLTQGMTAGLGFPGLS